MSKSKGNLVAPEEILRHASAPTPCACSTCSSGPPAGRRRLGGRRHRGLAPVPAPAVAPGRAATAPGTVADREPTPADVEIDRAAHRLIAAGHRRATSAGPTTPRWPAFMEFTNDLYHYVQSTTAPGRDARRRRRHPAAAAGARWRPTSPPSCGSGAGGDHIHAEPWPVADPAMADGRHGRRWSCRSTARCATASRSTPASTRPRPSALALASREGARRTSNGGQPKKVIARPPKLVNIVV